MNQKRSQSGANAALLIALIAAIIILYIFFLPPEDRKELLGDNTTSSDDNDHHSSDGSNKNKTFVHDNPGRVDYIDQDTVEKLIPSFHLFMTTNAKELESFSPFVIKNGWFDKQSKKLSFTLEDVKNTDNVILTIQGEGSGILKIVVNGEPLFEGEASQTIEPIKIPKKILLKENVVEMSVSAVGWQFWSTNEYQIKSSTIIGDITDTTRQKSENTFHLSKEELDNVESAKLKFFPSCQPLQVGVLEIKLNNDVIYKSVPDCDSMNIQEFSPASLLEQQNTLLFSTEKGTYLLDQIKIDMELKEPIPLTYYFDVTSDDINYLADNYDANLTIEFTDDTEYKRAELYVSGQKIYVATRDRVYTIVIDSYLKEGTNYVKLLPKTTLDIVDLSVESYEK